MLRGLADSDAAWLRDSRTIQITTETTLDPPSPPGNPLRIIGFNRKRSCFEDEFCQQFMVWVWNSAVFLADFVTNLPFNDKLVRTQ